MTYVLLSNAIAVGGGSLIGPNLKFPGFIVSSGEDNADTLTF